jgi:glycosyltransferase involved in cell wall biosynthesis
MDPAHAPHKKLEKLQGVLAKCHRILVHAPGDLNRLKALGLIDNVAIFPHGIQDYTSLVSANSHYPKAAQNVGFTIASYGFFLPHKGLLELIEAVALLRKAGQNVRLQMVNAEYPSPESTAEIQKAKKKISGLDLSEYVRMTTDFLSDDESLSLLAAADLIVFPHQNTVESSSAAVRYGLATGRPVAVTPLPIFDDVVSAVYTLPGMTPDQIAQGIRQLLPELAIGTERVRKKITDAARWREAHRYSRLGQRLYGMLQALARQNCQSASQA